MARIQLKRGLKANLPTSGMLAGEIFWTTDTNELFVATGATTKVPVAISSEDLDAIASVNGAEDLVMVYDLSENSGQKLKKMTFNDFKTALNIPAASSDEKVSTASGETAGYIWGTSGSDGVIRMGPSMQWTRNGAYVTLDVNVIDCGTF